MQCDYARVRVRLRMRRFAAGVGHLDALRVRNASGKCARGPHVRAFSSPTLNLAHKGLRLGVGPARRSFWAPQSRRAIPKLAISEVGAAFLKLNILSSIWLIVFY